MWMVGTVTEHSPRAAVSPSLGLSMERMIFAALAPVQAALPVDGQLIADLKQVFRRDVYSRRAAWQALI